jgi:hypothetical protein
MSICSHGDLVPLSQSLILALSGNRLRAGQTATVMAPLPPWALLVLVWSVMSIGFSLQRWTAPSEEVATVRRWPRWPMTWFLPCRRVSLQPVSRRRVDVVVVYHCEEIPLRRACLRRIT